MTAKVESASAQMATKIAQEAQAGLARSSLFDMAPRPHNTGSKSCVSLAVAPVHDDEEEEFAPRQKVEYENSYRMEPPKRFVPERVKQILCDTLEKELANMTYEPVSCSTQCKSIAQEVKLRVRALDYQRFKLVCIVNIGEKRDQDVRLGSRCLWDANRDNFACASYENQHIYATATVYAVYYE
ncbi:tctex1 domain-containing protein 1-like [Acanthaster planci]|uniref:Tctex1 domain-containing protein 1-like n=1 Tax=Acanthaster planci TaxID=133434 RepID=A0A8B7Y3Z1_ACAPL|nr:tctex1 domain-containing protein 1-like [Acanthaster planci]XP_022087258.1 tctex1 domain-containing protein 1-like [Acanthaster planci]